MTTACGASYFTVSYDGAYRFKVYRTINDYSSYDIIYTPQAPQYASPAAMCTDNKTPTHWVLGAAHRDYTQPQTGTLMFYSADDGLTWSAASLDSGGLGIVAIATDNNGVWIAVTDPYDRELSGFNKDINRPARILRSTNDGASWTTVRQLSDATILRYISGIPQYPGASTQGVSTDGNGVWLVTCGVDIYRSIDNGLNWTKAYTYPGYEEYYSPYLYSVDTDGEGVWLTTFPNEEGNSEILRSTNNGTSWSVATTILGAYPDVNAYGLVHTDRKGTWVMGTEYCDSEIYDNMFVSTNNGDTWTAAFKFEVLNVVVTAITHSPEGKWLATDFSVALSTDGGQSFTYALEGEYISALAYSGAMACPPGDLIVGAGVVFV